MNTHTTARQVGRGSGCQKSWSRMPLPACLGGEAGRGKSQLSEKIFRMFLLDSTASDAALRVIENQIMPVSDA